MAAGRRGGGCARGLRPEEEVLEAPALAFWWRGLGASSLLHCNCNIKGRAPVERVVREVHKDRVVGYEVLLMHHGAVLIQDPLVQDLVVRRDLWTRHNEGQYCQYAGIPAGCDDGHVSAYKAQRRLRQPQDECKLVHRSGSVGG